MKEIIENTLTPEKALAAIAESTDGLYTVLLENGSMKLGYYKPVRVDKQRPHDQDEIYIVQTGYGTFIRGDEQISFKAGDALFVAAGVDHRFVDFTDEFGTWVVFYGPPGGE